MPCTKEEEDKDRNYVESLVAGVLKAESGLRVSIVLLPTSSLHSVSWLIAGCCLTLLRQLATNWGQGSSWKDGDY